MARIPDDDIERIKQETDLAALVRSRGIDLKKHGSKDLIGCCPFHDDKKPSFVVTPNKGLFHCLGCGAAGNPIQFVQAFDGVSFRHAFELLNEGGGFSSNGKCKKSTVPKLDCPFDSNVSDAELLLNVVEYYHERLLQSPGAIEYLKKRNIFNEEMIECFRIGFADRSLGLRLPFKNRVEGKELRERLQSLGVLRESGHEHFNGSLTLPVFFGEDVTEIYGRKITAKLRKGTPLHLFLPGSHKGIWNLEALQGGEVVICEAPIDALSFWAQGIRNVTFIYGTNGFTDELFEALLTHRVKKIYLAYDNDESGNKATDRDAKRLLAHGIECLRVRFPLNVDANQFAENGSLEQALNSAEWLGGADSSNKKLAANLAAKKERVEFKRQGEFYVLSFGQRVYRVGGLDKNNSLEVLKIALRLKHEDDFHLDNIDLTRDDHRRRFVERGHEETGLEKELIKRDLAKLLLACEQSQEERLNTPNPKLKADSCTLTAEEKNEAIKFLKTPNLLKRIGKAFDVCGLVGEKSNRLAAYLACTSRKLDRPLAVIIQSTSAAGKTTLMEAVLSMFPEEERIKYSAMTGQSLYYLGETNLKHKILAIVEEEGAEKASYALKLLQSEGELTIASTGKDPNTGRMETQEYHVEGPVMIFLTTTAIDIDEELQNRCLVLSVDESREQTKLIHEQQRHARTLEGLRLRKKRKEMLKLLRNIQRLLKPVDVLNPFAGELTFTNQRTRTRRDHEKYLTLIDTIALLHQFQRKKEVEESCAFIRVTLEDIELANQLSPELFGRSLDELPPQTRRLYAEIKKLIRERCEKEKVDQRFALFSRREIRERLGWSVTQVRVHLERLCELEYIALQANRPGTPFQYELLDDCNASEKKSQIGLIDVKKLRLRQPPDGKNGGVTGG